MQDFKWPHYRLVLEIGPLESDEAARLFAAQVERVVNAGVGAVRITDVMRAEVVWDLVSACEVCGTMVCPGPQAHRRPEGEAGEVGLTVGLGAAPIDLSPINATAPTAPTAPYRTWYPPHPADPVPAGEGDGS